jgi:hypothetical protein
MKLFIVQKSRQTTARLPARGEWHCMQKIDDSSLHKNTAPIRHIHA